MESFRFPCWQLNRGHRSLGGTAVVSLGTLLLVVWKMRFMAMVSISTPCDWVLVRRWKMLVGYTKDKFQSMCHGTLIGPWSLKEQILKPSPCLTAQILWFFRQNRSGVTTRWVSCSFGSTSVSTSWILARSSRDIWDSAWFFVPTILQDCWIDYWCNIFVLGAIAWHRIGSSSFAVKFKTGTWHWTSWYC